jgi:hypothetical protein
MKFQDTFFHYSLIVLVLATVLIAYVRFMVIRNYMVAYEADCNSITESCFIGCEDDECLTTYYYSLIEKPAADVYAQCGAHIADCEAINHCLATNDFNCSKSYCDPVVDGELCETITSDGVQISETQDAISTTSEESSLPI